MGSLQELIFHVYSDLLTLYQMESPLPIQEYVYRTPGPRDETLLHVQEDTMFLRLRLTEKTIQTLSKHNPLEEGITATNIERYCSLVEEMSHFTHMSHYAQKERPFRLVDIEILGGLDQYILTQSLQASRGEHRFSRGELRQIIFHWQPPETLLEEEQERYRMANHLALSYSRLLDPLSPPECIHALRTLASKGNIVSTLSHLA